MSMDEKAVTRQIALKSRRLEMRRQSLQQHRAALRESALRYCRKPSTLGAAALSGFVLARLFASLRSHHQLTTPSPSRVLDPLLQMIPVLLVERVRQAMVRRTQRLNYRQNAEEKHSVAGSL
jgi:hypothetical protein